MRRLLRSRLAAVGLLMLVIATSGCGGRQAEWPESAAPAEHGFPADLAQRIDSYVDEYGLDLHAVLVVAQQ